MDAHTPPDPDTAPAPDPEAPGVAPRRRLRLPRVSPRTRAAVTSVLSATLLTAAVAGLAVAAKPMQDGVISLRSAQPRVAFDWPPLRGEVSSAPAHPGAEPRTWVNADVRAELEALVLQNVSPNPLDAAGLPAARAALMKTGWFRQDLRLERDADSLVRVTATWRLPAAAVRWGGKDVLVSSAGDRLPLEYAPDASGYKAIVGVFHEPPDPGEAWLGGDVKAALGLLELLARVPGYEQVAGIDVTGFTGKHTLVIVTDSGARITWGGPVDEFNPGQATHVTKLARLVQLRRDYGRIDAGRPAIDVRLVDNVYVIDTTGALAQALAAEGTKPAKGKAPPKGDGKKPARR